MNVSSVYCLALLITSVLRLLSGFSPFDYPSTCRTWSATCGSSIDVEIFRGAPPFGHCFLPAPLNTPSRPKCMLEAFVRSGQGEQSVEYQPVSESCLREFLPASCNWRPHLYVCMKTGEVKNAGTVRGPLVSLRFSNGLITSWKGDASLNTFKTGMLSCFRVDQVSMIGELSLRRHLDAVGIRIPSKDGWCLEEVALLLTDQECKHGEDENCFNSAVERLVWPMSRMKTECAPCGSHSFSSYGGKRCYWFDQEIACHSPEMILYNDKRRTDQWGTKEEPPCSFFYNKYFASADTLFESSRYLFVPEYASGGEGEMPDQGGVVKHSCSSDEDCKSLGSSSKCDGSETEWIPFPYPRCRHQVSFNGNCTDASDNLCISGMQCSGGKCLPETEAASIGAKLGPFRFR